MSWIQKISGATPPQPSSNFSLRWCSESADLKLSHFDTAPHPPKSRCCPHPAFLGNWRLYRYIVITMLQNQNSQSQTPGIRYMVGCTRNIWPELIVYLLYSPSHGSESTVQHVDRKPDTQGVTKIMRNVGVQEPSVDYIIHWWQDRPLSWYKLFTKEGTQIIFWSNHFK